MSLTQGQPTMVRLHFMSFSCCFSDLCFWHPISSSHTNCTRSDTKKLTTHLKDVEQGNQKEVCFKLSSRRTPAQPYLRACCGKCEGGLQLGKEPSVIVVCHCRGRAPSSQCFWPSKPFVKNVLLHILI